MIRIDDTYTQYREDNIPGYPGGKVVSVSAGNKTDGTPWRALWFNTILGFFQAIIVEAEGSFKVSGQPDKVGQSDLLNAIKKIMQKTINPTLDEQIKQNKEDIASHNEIIAQNSEEILAILNNIATYVLEAPDDGHLYGRKNKRWQEVVPVSGSTIGDTIEVLKVFSKTTLVLTNAAIVDRRLKRYDIGLPYISPLSEVYHFDTDFKNQNQTSSISIGYTTAPVLVGRDDSNGQIYLSPAMSDVAPYENPGKSIYGNFDISSKIPNANSTVEFWLRLPFVSNIAVLRVKTPKGEEFIFSIGGQDILYSVAASGDILYSVPDADDIPYSVAPINNNRIEHFSPKGSETVNMSSVEIQPNTWTHIAFVATAQKFAIFIGNTYFEAAKHYQTMGEESDIIINEGRGTANIDELMIDRFTALIVASFISNTTTHMPYAGLDYTQNWAVLMFDNPNRVATNLFESEQFRMAVLAAINNT